MVDQMTLQTIGILLTAVTVSIAAIYYALTLSYTRRNQELQLETRQAQLFSQLWGMMSDVQSTKGWAEFFYTWEYDDFDDWWNKYGPEANPDAFAYFMKTSLQKEGIGVMVKRGLLDVGLIADWVSGLVIFDWEKIEPIIQGYRLLHSYPHFQEYHEYLYNEVKKYKEKHPELVPLQPSLFSSNTNM